MSKSLKKWLIAAASFVVIGLIIFAAAMSAYHWNFSRLSTDQYETNTHEHEIKEEFNNIELNIETADILFAASNDNMCRVVCYEQESMKHSVSVQDGTLTVNVVDEREWYEHIGIDLHSSKVTVYLPKAEYASLCITESTGDIVIPDKFAFDSVDVSLSTGDVFLSASSRGTAKIQTSTGAVNVTNAASGALDLYTSTGKITVSDVTCQGDIRISVSTGKAELTNTACRHLLSSGSTGDISLKNVNAAEKISIGRSTGYVRFDGSDAAEIFVKTDTGDVTGSLLSEKVFITETSTGSISVPKTTTGGKCEIVTSTGDIEIEIAK